MAEYADQAADFVADIHGQGRAAGLAEAVYLQAFRIAVEHRRIGGSAQRQGFKHMQTRLTERPRRSEF